ncbi:MAG: Fic family protein [Bacteroidales bacterium]|nr:Fic family protein [Bacteroidales bacterium]
MQNNSDTDVDLEEYIIQGEPGRKERAENWQVAIGLQAVDGLKPSRYLLQTAQEHIEERISMDEVDRRITSYYQSEAGRREQEGTDEADGVAARIARLLAEETFTFSPAMLASIHRRLFENILPRAGRYRQTNITKKEWVLDGDTVLYSPCDMIGATLDYDFAQEKMFSYQGLPLGQVVWHLCSFVAGIWQIHPFGEGNTRTTAVFTIKYLRQMGYKVDNEPFKRHSWYFRNALVRANYQNLPKEVGRTTEYLELFFRNLLMGEDNELKNRYLHIRWQDNSMVVSEPCMVYGTEVGSEKRTKGTEKRQKSSEKILALISENPDITTELMAREVGISTRAVEKHLSNLKAKGRLRRVGPDKGGHWEAVGE